MEKRNNKKGFTLAELLIVVAIIAVLVAIAIPIFTSQLEKSREATDMANVRSAYGSVVTAYLTDGSATSMTVSASQKNDGWENGNGTLTGMGADGTSTIDIASAGAKSGGSWEVAIDASGNVTISGQ